MAVYLFQAQMPKVVCRHVSSLLPHHAVNGDTGVSETHTKYRWSTTSLKAAEPEAQTSLCVLYGL